MVLNKPFIHQLQVVPSPLARILVKRNFNNPVLASAKISTSFRDILSPAFNRWRNVKVLCKDGSQNMQQSRISGTNPSRLPELAFDRLQLGNEELCKGQKRAFGRFLARGAVVDEEYWTAAWLRAESHWGSLSYMRHIDSYKRKYAEQEYYALKHRCSGRDGNSLKCFCIVTVKKEDPNVRRTVLNSVVGTLDLSIRQFLQGETFPGEPKKVSTILVSHDTCEAHRYAYIANVCVSKFARRQGIGSNMVHLASEIAVSSGMKKIYIHVNLDNRPAQELYRKAGFEVVEAASCPLLTDQRILMCMEL